MRRWFDANKNIRQTLQRKHRRDKKYFNTDWVVSFFITFSWILFLNLIAWPTNDLIEFLTKINIISLSWFLVNTKLYIDILQRKIIINSYCSSETNGIFGNTNIKQWRIQDFPDGEGRQPQRWVRQLIIFQNCCRENWTERGRACLAPPWIHHC